MTVYSVKSSVSDARGVTDLTVHFNNPKGSKAKGGDAVGLALPYQWCGHHAGGLRSGAKGLTADVSETDSKGVLKSVGTTVSTVGGCNVWVTLASGKTLAEKMNYTLSVKGVPTPVSAGNCWGSVRVSAGSSAKGALAHSHAHSVQANLASNYFTFGKLTELSFSSSTVSLARGTYSKDKVCVTSKAGKFASTVSFKLKSAGFKALPAEWPAKLGEASTCGQLGTESKTAASHFDLVFEKVETVAKYTPLPVLHASVTAAKSTVTVPTTCACVVGGLSDPLLVKTDGSLPYSDVTVKLKKKVKAKTAKATDPEPSAGITLDSVPSS